MVWFGWLRFVVFFPFVWVGVRVWSRAVPFRWRSLDRDSSICLAGFFDGVWFVVVTASSVGTCRNGRDRRAAGAFF